MKKIILVLAVIVLVFDALWIINQYKNYLADKSVIGNPLPWEECRNGATKEGFIKWISSSKKCRNIR